MSQEQNRLTPLADVREEGLRLVRAAADRGLAVRLIGGVAIWARCPSAMLPGLRREYGDVDVIGLSQQSRALVQFFQEMGYRPDKLFNAIHGAQRLNFTVASTGRPLDVLLDRFSMCHAIDLRDRLASDLVTIPLADLLLTKLQVVRMNEKDLLDLTAMLADHGLDGASSDVIDLGRVTAVLGKDWGFEHTVRLNLDRLRSFLTERGLPAHTTGQINDRIAGLLSALRAGHKSVGWQLRSRIGERVRWYEEPEEVRH